MRLKKKVLVCGSDADEMGRLGYVMWARGYAPVLAQSAAAAVEALAAHDIACAVALAFHGPVWAEDAIVAMLEASPGLRTLLLAPASSALVTRAAVIVDPRDMARVVEAVRVLCLRRRGPKKAGAQYACDIGAVSSKLQRVG